MWKCKGGERKRTLCRPFTYLSLGRAGEWRRQKIHFNWTHYTRIKKGKKWQTNSICWYDFRPVFVFCLLFFVNFTRYGKPLMPPHRSRSIGVPVVTTKATYPRNLWLKWNRSVECTHCCSANHVSGVVRRFVHSSGRKVCIWECVGSVSAICSCTCTLFVFIN